MHKPLASFCFIFAAIQVKISTNEFWRGHNFVCNTTFWGLKMRLYISIYLKMFICSRKFSYYCYILQSLLLYHLEVTLNNLNENGYDINTYTVWIYRMNNRNKPTMHSWMYSYLLCRRNYLGKNNRKVILRIFFYVFYKTGSNFSLCPKTEFG